MICWFKKTPRTFKEMSSAVCRAGRKIKTSSHPVLLPALMFFLKILFIPQAGVKGKLGRLLGVFEVSILRKLAEQSAPTTGETALRGFFISQL